MYTHMMASGTAIQPPTCLLPKALFSQCARTLRHRHHVHYSTLLYLFSSRCLYPVLFSSLSSPLFSLLLSSLHAFPETYCRCHYCLTFLLSPLPEARRTERKRRECLIDPPAPLCMRPRFLDAGLAFSYSRCPSAQGTSAQACLKPSSTPRAIFMLLCISASHTKRHLNILTAVS